MRKRDVNRESEKDRERACLLREVPATESERMLPFVKPLAKDDQINAPFFLRKHTKVRLVLYRRKKFPLLSNGPVYLAFLVKCCLFSFDPDMGHVSSLAA